MILAVIESDYGTLHLVDRLIPGASGAALEIAIDGSSSDCLLDIDCDNCKIRPQCDLLSENSSSNKDIAVALSIFGLNKSNSPEFFI